MAGAPGKSDVPGASFARALLEARPIVVAALASHLGDLDAAEEAFADACVALTESGARPDTLAGWLIAVGKRKAIDRIRKRDARQRADDGAMEIADIQEGEMDNVIQLPEAIPDERLRLIFICCHPALALEARAALALKVICGLPVPAIAELFLTSETTMFARITRAKAKIRDAGVSFELPPRREWPERIDAVLLALELAYTSAYSDAGQSRAVNEGGELAGEVERLTTMLTELLPKEPEILGLAALVTLARSREGARVDSEGAMVPLSQQDTGLWDAERIERARDWLESASACERAGPYQVMAAIQLTHARRAFDGAVDWRAIGTLYDALMALRPGPMVALNRALALAEVEGPDPALAELDALTDPQLMASRPYWAARAHLCERGGQRAQACAALDEALARDPGAAERAFLQQWRARLEGGR
ncbi:MAG: DUF6596 domain-containing protein [Pseudomonadota bacterium]